MDDTQHCAICMDTPHNQVVLSQCRHVFCFQCIFEWSQFGKKAIPCTAGYINLSAVEPTCPLCKQRFELGVESLSPHVLDVQIVCISSLPSALMTCHGCAQQFYAKEFVSHCLSCQHILLTCSLCDLKYPTGGFKQHIMSECNHVPCHCCELQTSWIRLKMHRGLKLTASVILNVTQLINETTNGLLTNRSISVTKLNKLHNILKSLRQILSRLVRIFEDSNSGTCSEQSNTEFFQLCHRATSDVRTSLVYVLETRAPVADEWSFVDSELSVNTLIP